VERRETVRKPDAGNAKRICEVVNSVFCSFSAKSADQDEPQIYSRRMTPIGTPELVLLLVALGGMTAAATWGVMELKKPRRWM
jgi:hypothetical protein